MLIVAKHLKDTGIFNCPLVQVHATQWCTEITIYCEISISQYFKTVFIFLIFQQILMAE
jgi:hypothetical protein